MGKRGKITTKAVQEREGKPYAVPNVELKPEVDDEEPAGDDGLNVRRRLFVDYLTGEARGNATRAAQLAGYSDSNNNVLKQTASRLLTFVDVQRAIRERLSSVNLTNEGTRRAIASYSQASMDAFLSVDAEGNPVMDWAKAAAAGAIGHVREYREKGIQQGQEVTVVERAFKVRDPMPALILLAKMHGLVSEHPTVTVNVTQVNEDDLVRIATRGGGGTPAPTQGPTLADRLR